MSTAHCALLAVLLLGAFVLGQAFLTRTSGVSVTYMDARSTGKNRPAQSTLAPAVSSDLLQPNQAETGPQVHAAASMPYFIMIGTPSGVDQRNRERRMILRDLWFTEYANIGRTLGAEFLMSLITAQGEAQPELVAKQLHAEQRQHGDIVLLHAREPTSDPNRRHPVNSGEKVLAWFRYAVVQHYGTRFFIKAEAVLVDIEALKGCFTHIGQGVRDLFKRLSW